MSEDTRRREVNGEKSEGAWDSIRRHPVIATTLLGCAVIGAVAGFYFLTGEWSAARRILAGAFAGAGTGLLITATKMIS